MSITTFKRTRPLWIVVLIVTGAALAATGLAQAGPPRPKAATSAQQEEFVALWHRYQKIYFDASVSDDLSSYPTIFVNDPAVDLATFVPDCIPLIDKERMGVATTLQSLGQSPVAAAGWMSCAIAEQIDYHRNVDAWQSAKQAAAAKGVEPSAETLPVGLRPMEPTNPNDWRDDPIYVIDAVLRGDNQARVTYASVPKDQNPGLFFNLMLMRVNSQWYISAVWSSGTDYGL